MKTKLISKKKETMYWDCIVQYEGGVQVRVLLEDSDVLKYELREKLELLKIPQPILDEINKNIDDMLQAKYSEGLDSAAQERHRRLVKGENMKVKKLVNKWYFRLWVFPRSTHQYYIWRKSLKRLGYIIFCGKLRISFTIVR